MSAPDSEEYVRVIKDYSYSHQGQQHRIYRNDTYLVIEKRNDWWRLVSKRGKLIWAPKDYLVETKLTVQQKKEALQAEYQGSQKVRNTTKVDSFASDTSQAAALHTSAPNAPNASVPYGSASHSSKTASGLASAHFKDTSGNASAWGGTQEEVSRKSVIQKPWPTKEELKISHQNHIEEQLQQALAREEPSLLSRKLSKKKDQKLSKKDISLPTLNTYNQPHFDIKDPHASSKRQQKISKNDISHPIFCSQNSNASDILPSPPVASSFKPFSDAMLNSDQNMNPLNASKPLLSTGLSSRSSRLSLYDGSCSSESLEDILEESTLCSSMKHSPYNDLGTDKTVMHPINGRKASSDERLDSPSRIDDQRNVFSQLSHRNRSNSVDFKSFSRDRLFNDPNDNVVKPSKSSENERHVWRRSLALEEYNQSNNCKTPMQDDFDASHWLDSPPSLPPKKNRSRTNVKDSQLGKVVQSSAKTSPPSSKWAADDSLPSSGTNDIVSFHWDRISARQQLPHSRDQSRQSFQRSTKLYSKDETTKAKICASCGVLACSDQLCKAIVQENISSNSYKRNNSTYENVPDSPVISGAMTRSYTCIGTFSSSGYSPNSSVRASKRSENTLSPNGSSMKRNDEMKRSFKESTAGHVRKSSLRGFFQKKVSSKSDSKRQELSSIQGSESGGKKLPQCPPCPDSNHELKRKLDDNWLEYWYPEYKCFFYYNEVTKEKKWKPPRKHLSRQMPVDELEMQGGAGHSDGSSAHSPPEYSTQRSMTPSSRTSSVGSLGETSSPPTFPPQPHSIESHCSSVASSSPSYVSYTASTEGCHGSSSEVSPCYSRDLHSGYYSDQIGASFPHGDREEVRQFDATGATEYVDDQSYNDRPVLPPRPPNGAKPSQYHTASDALSASVEPLVHRLASDESESGSAALREALQTYTPPEGWRKRACSSRYIFFNMSNGEKWEATCTDDGKIYFFNTETGDSNWELPETSARHPSLGGSGNTSETDDTLPHSSPGTPTASPLSHKIVKQGYLVRTLYYRERKKVRKNWSSMYAMLVARLTDGLPSSGTPQQTPPSGSDALQRPSRYFIAFSKSADDKKTRDEFELLEPIRVVIGADKNKTSRTNILSLTNAAGTELLLRHDEISVIEEWHSTLRDLDVELVYPSPPASPRKHHKSGDKASSGDASSGATATESLSTDQRTIRNKLLGLIKRRPTADSLAKKGIIKDSVFGSTIAEVCMKEKTKSPLFVLRCINAIERKDSNLKTDGLYRISGNAAMIQTIRYEVEKNNYEVLLEEKDVNNLTGALKLFFRELKEPLLPFNTYELFIKWNEKAKHDRRAGERLYEIVKLLPKENLETLKLLLRHLRRVCEYEAHNRMNYSNMAIVFGPCLMWPQTTTGRDQLTQAMCQNMVVEGLLHYYE